MNDDNHWIANKDIYYEWMLKLSTNDNDYKKEIQGEFRKFPPEPQLKPFEFIEAEEMMI